MQKIVCGDKDTREQLYVTKSRAHVKDCVCGKVVWERLCVCDKDCVCVTKLCVRDFM